MVDRDIILGKVGVIERCLHRIRSVTKEDPSSLDDFMVQDAVVLNLQRAVQASIDMAAHIVAEEKLNMPASMSEYFSTLREAQIIPVNVEKLMKKMVGFRNIAVHDYWVSMPLAEELDIDILKSIVKDHLTDFEKYFQILVTRYV